MLPFSSGIELGIGASATFIGNRSQCPFCGSMENIPDGTFKGTVEGIVKILESSSNKFQAVKDLLEALEKSKTSKDLDRLKKSPKFLKLKKWLPDSPEKIAAYIAIVYTIFQLFLKQPNVSIQYNQQFIKIYNEYIILQKGK